MHLWNDYEGQTIAEAYPLEKLLRPEGRSAFFITSDKTGSLNVIRLTESLNDEHEMLENWRHVSEVHQENLVTIKTFGRTTFDGVPLAYALMEPTDGSLAEILTERPLTLAETVEVANSLSAALSALHATNLIHQHIEAANVVASGDVIKLRSDCVRECIEDAEFNTPAMCAEFKHKDVQDFALLLLRCLTLERCLSPTLRLPAPFDRIIPRSLDGSWGLPEIAAALRIPAARSTPTLAANVLPVTPAARGRSAARTASASEAELPIDPQLTSRPIPLQAALPFADSSAASVADGPTLKVRRTKPEITAVPASIPRSWLAGGAAAIVLLVLIWFFARGKSPSPAVAGATVAPASDRLQTLDDVPDGKTGKSPSAAVSSRTTAAVGSPRPAQAGKPKAGPELSNPGGGWRVVCYTFSREEQAWTRAGAIHKTHPGLNAQVVATSPHGPYLIAVGGPMSSRSEAEAVLRRARRDGMPRDTFARFYPAR